MLNLYARIAKRLVPYKPVFWLAIVIVAVIIVAIFTSANLAYEPWLVPSALMALWILLVLMLIQLFPNIPDFSLLDIGTATNTDSKHESTHVKRTLGRWQRFKLKMKKFAYQSIAIIFSFLTLALLFLTYRSLNVALSG